MNFDFSQEQQQLRETVRRFLSQNCPTKAVRTVLEGHAKYDAALWKGLAELGLLGVAIPSEYGGTGAGELELCVVAEELGRALAPVPYASCIYFSAELLRRHGDEAQKQRWLPKIAAGEAIGTLAFAEGVGDPTLSGIRCAVSGGKLRGRKSPVADGEIANFAIVAARRTDGGIGLFIVDLAGPGVSRAALDSVDPTRNLAELTFEDAPAEPLGPGADGYALLTSALDRAAALVAFEQVGGADRALEMARDYALDRMAFGRPIGSFQAIKHMLADIYVANTLARSNAYWGAWALGSGSAELAEAAASARVSATEAYRLAAKNSMQAHGGIGFTWEYDCHLHYKRAQFLALAYGSPRYWENRLIDEMRRRNAA
jgi:alkylation response protein AidB-like acyl-CoA dehydrogenase